jgi:ABC-type glycerol-3-phosphate transport system substrate-binding protein
MGAVRGVDIVKRPRVSVIATSAFLAASLSVNAFGVAGASTKPASTTLTVWSFQGSSSNKTAGIPYAFYLIDNQFEKLHPNIKINMVLQNFGDYREIFATAATAHKGPDVWETLPGAYLYEYDSALLPLNKYVSPQLKASLQGWSGGIVPEWTNNGTIYGIPSELQSLIWYYNKADFTKAGITSAPATWTEFLADCKKLKAAGFTPIANGNTTYFGEQNLLAAMLAEMEPASKQLGIGNGSVSWTSPVVKTAMTQIFDLKPYYNPGFVGLTLLPGAVNLFAGDKAAMYLGIVSNNQNYFQFQQTLGVNNLGEFRQPSMGSQYSQYAPAMTITSDYMWTVPRWAPDPSAAVAYSEFMETSYAEHILLVDGGDFPNLTPVSQSQFNANPSTKLIESILQGSKLVPQATANLDTALTNYLVQQTSDVFDGSESINSALSAVQSYATTQP